MSTFTRYAAHSERSTAIRKHDSAETLTITARLDPRNFTRAGTTDYHHAETPVSGDMLATIRRGTLTEQRKRRQRATPRIERGTR